VKLLPYMPPNKIRGGNPTRNCGRKKGKNMVLARYRGSLPLGEGRKKGCLAWGGGGDHLNGEGDTSHNSLSNGGKRCIVCFMGFKPRGNRKKEEFAGVVRKGGCPLEDGRWGGVGGGSTLGGMPERECLKVGRLFLRKEEVLYCDDRQDGATQRREKGK